MKVDIQPDVRDFAARLGGGVPYALKTVAARLAADPDLGRPSGLPGVLTVTVDGDMFENCPNLSVGYVREPDRVEIRFLRADLSAEPPTQEQEEDQEQDQPDDPATAAVTVREVADAWHRITAWLRSNAPDSYAALRPGARPAALATLEAALGIPLPVALRTLWLLTAGDDGADGRACLPGNMALMNLDAVAAHYRLKTTAQSDQDALNTDRPEEERITVWKPTRIPVIALGPTDSTSGLYLDTTTGYLGSWSRYNEPPGDELDTLVTYLEETADMLETPALATRDKPGLIDGTLVWLSDVDPTRESGWRPVTG
ncbi:hypothetical protein ABZT04_35025 [Streptomyces sp. NPDC005492]|uniref:hypothetical protein n=1 Tax=Streptomyces sp. NPDC005492 TaxID=3156883 RepID=UPI0033A2469E